jgi:hypothetical protein
MQTEELFAIVFSLVVLSGVFIVVMGLRQRSQQLEMRHKERMAMIEKGMSPVPQLPPAVMAAIEVRSGAASRSLTLGIVIVAVGMGLATVVSIAGGSPEAGIGVGGGIAILGAAFIVNSLVNRGSSQHLPPSSDDAL